MHTSVLLKVIFPTFISSECGEWVGGIWTNLFSLIILKREVFPALSSPKSIILAFFFYKETKERRNWIFFFKKFTMNIVFLYLNFFFFFFGNFFLITFYGLIEFTFPCGNREKFWTCKLFIWQIFFFN